MSITTLDLELPGDAAERFTRDGYMVLRNFLSEEEITPLEEIYGRFMRNEVKGMGRDFCDMSGPYDRPYEHFSIINAVLPRKYAPELRDNVFEQRAFAVAQRLIGPDIGLDYDQFLSKKPEKSDAVFAWHQDLGYWPTGTPDTRTVTCSLALDDADLENGCLGVIPGSNREAALRPHRPALRAESENERDESHTLVADLTAEDQIVHLPVRRGDITLHDERIVHGSGGNNSDRWRRTYVIAFRSVATVEYERSIGFTHSHNDTISWRTHLEALADSGE